MIYFLTGNENKLREARQILGDDVEQLVLDIELPEIQSLDPIEVLTHKITSAVEYLEHHDEYDRSTAFFVEDVSILCRALGGFPGPLVKWCVASMGAQGLYRMLTDYQDKSAVAICSIGYRDGERIHFIVGEVSGQIVSQTGVSLFGRDGVFLPDGYDQTFEQMDVDIKNSMSHRRIALDLLHSQITAKSL